VDRDRLAKGDALGRTPDGEPGRVAAVLDSGHLAEFCHDPGEHPRLPPRNPACGAGSGGGAGTRSCAARGDRPPACCLPSGLSPSVPDFHRRFGVSPTPEHALTPISQCATRGIPARTAVGIALRRERAELVADAVLGDQALTVTRAELAPDPADVHVHGAAVPRDGLAVPSGGPAPGSLDQIRAGEHRGRVRAEEGQQLELPEGQLDLAPVGPDAALRVVQAQPGTLGAPAAWR